MNVSIKKRIYWSFFILVFLFVVNGIASIITLSNNRKLSENVSSVTDPSLQSLEDFDDLLVASKMYTTNWVFLRSSQEDKDALIKLHNTDYPKLKQRLNFLSAKWNDTPSEDSLKKIYAEFEQLLMFENKIMSSLQKFEDYDDPAIKMEAERIVEDELLPRTTAIINSLGKIQATVQSIRAENNIDLEKSFMYLRLLITVLAITIISIGIFLSLYMTRIIINPINKIRNIINDLGKGIIKKVDNKVNNDEIGEMVNSVNNLSEKLHATAAFAAEIGNRNFNTNFEPLSTNDTLGKALVTMRDSLKTSDQKLNEAQHIAHLGNWERDVATGKVFFSDEMLNIFDIDSASFDLNFQS
ncbi:MAG: HAMP domain-containing protein, partial [Ginsengibacter sp.]